MRVIHLASAMAPTRWGFVSAGKISNDFKVALDTLPKEEHQVVAVAARSLESAQKFAKTHNIPTAYGSYAELAAQKDIDVVYIGSIHTQHAPVTTMMLQAGKPVLCEKPMAVNSREAQQMIGLAKEKNIFFMEAVWSCFFPAYLKIREIIDSGAVGEVKVVTACFGYNVNIDVPRLTERPSGSMLDMGIWGSGDLYQFATMVFGGEEPQDITTSGHLISDGGVDETVTVVLKYSGNRMATLLCSMSANMPNEAYVCGTMGFLKIPTFWCPTEVIAPDKTHEFPLPPPEKPLNYENSTGMRFEAMEVRRCLQEGLKESPLMTHAMSLQIAGILDRARKVAGVVYDQDKE
ncbi:trans-1,2-dihydrobenzene-1,2-diol dehydrogenase-like isoform X3 [Branchiostoma lanceolatum]|uniref:trans-1,2-dihydrobenzene-1,2-diol dehydrogenase-like isoform X3 n=1 Tax=Branchiostoma lanceolatum TaxID=7740 RepID=UPI0034544ACC